MRHTSSPSAMTLRCSDASMICLRPWSPRMHSSTPSAVPSGPTKVTSSRSVERAVSKSPLVQALTYVVTMELASDPDMATSSGLGGHASVSTAPSLRPSPREFVAALVGVGLHLERGVPDPVAVTQDGPGPVEHPVGVGAIPHHEVHGGNVHLRCQRPHMQVVDIDHAVDGLQLRLDPGEVGADRPPRPQTPPA